MSMNLQCHEIELWQTPTWLTRIALYDAHQNVRDPVETAHIYMAWVKQHTNGAWKDRYNEMMEVRENVREHVNQIKDAHIKEFWEI